MSTSPFVPFVVERFPRGCKSVDRVFVDGEPAAFSYDGNVLTIHGVFPPRVGGNKVVAQYRLRPLRKARGSRIQARRLKAAKRRAHRQA